MYVASDPRAGLPSAAEPEISSDLAPVELGLFYQEAPSDDDANGRTWYLRGQNFVVAHTEAKRGARLRRQGQVDEYAVLVTDRDTPVELTTDREAVKQNGFFVGFVPPGDSLITLPEGGVITRLFTSRSKDLTARCPNNASYASHRANIPPLESWPAPRGGYKLRTYGLDVPPEHGRFGRIWRCTTFMINMFDPQVGMRDITKLSPHSHNDFEQCSLALEGGFIHHFRWPWGSNLSNWRQDEHPHVRSPSAVVVPPPVIHTTRNVDDGVNQLVDIFCPPRLDFSQKPGWVLNAEDYPMPDHGR